MKPASLFGPIATAKTVLNYQFRNGLFESETKTTPNPLERLRNALNCNLLIMHAWNVSFWTLIH